MSRKTKIALVSSMVVALGTAAALSQAGGGHGRHHDRWIHQGNGEVDEVRHGRMHGGWFGRQLTKDAFDTRTRERFARFDRNSDGVVEAAEVEAVVASRLKKGRAGDRDRMLDRLARQFDDDRDGRIAREEFLAGAKRRFTEMDLDSDGRITDADLPPVMRGRMALAGREGVQGKGARHEHMGPWALFEDADADNDGVITREEALAAAQKNFAFRDRNGDGVIDASDAEALRAATLDYRVKRILHHHGAGSDGRVTREQFTAKANERFARLDRNNDGVIGRSEMPGRGHGRHMDGGMGDGMHGKRGRVPSETPPAEEMETAPGKAPAPPSAPAR